MSFLNKTNGLFHTNSRNYLKSFLAQFAASFERSFFTWVKSVVLSKKLLAFIDRTVYISPVETSEKSSLRVGQTFFLVDFSVKCQTRMSDPPRKFNISEVSCNKLLHDTMLTKADNTRQMIIEKSSHLFNTKGYAATSMSDILEATGLAKGGVYGNFKSKEEIALHAFDYAFRKVMDDLALKVQSKSHSIEKLHAILSYYNSYDVNSPIEGGCPILNTSCDLDDMNPTFRRRVKQAMDIILGSLVRIIEAGKKNGEIRKHVDAEAAADIIFSQIEGGIVLSKTYGNSNKLNRLLDNLKNYIDRELKA